MSSTFCFVIILQLNCYSVCFSFHYIEHSITSYKKTSIIWQQVSQAGIIDTNDIKLKIDGTFELIYGQFEAAIQLDDAVVAIETDGCLTDLDKCLTADATGLTLSTRIKFTKVEEKV